MPPPHDKLIVHELQILKENDGIDFLSLSTISFLFLSSFSFDIKTNSDETDLSNTNN